MQSKKNIQQTEAMIIVTAAGNWEVISNAHPRLLIMNALSKDFQTI